MVRLVFDLLLGKVLGVVWFEGHAVIAHALGTVSAHLGIFWSVDLAILLVQCVVQRRLLDRLPWVLDQLLGSSGRDGDGAQVVCSGNGLAVQSVRAFRVTVRVGSLLFEVEEDLRAVTWR